MRTAFQNHEKKGATFFSPVNLFFLASSSALYLVHSLEIKRFYIDTFITYFYASVNTLVILY